MERVCHTFAFTLSSPHACRIDKCTNLWVNPPRALLYRRTLVLSSSPIIRRNNERQYIHKEWKNSTEELRDTMYWVSYCAMSVNLRLFEIRILLEITWEVAQLPVVLTTIIHTWGWIRTLTISETALPITLGLPLIPISSLLRGLYSISFYYERRC